MPVHVVIAGIFFKGGLNGPAAGDIDRLNLAALGGGHRREIYRPETKPCFHPEEILPPLNEGVTKAHTHIASLNFLKDLVFSSAVLQLELVLEIEGGLGVKIRVELHLLADLPDYTELDLLVEVENSRVLLANGQVRVVCPVVVDGKIQRGQARGAHRDRPASKHIAQFAHVDVQLQAVAAVAVGSHGLFTEVFLHTLFAAIFQIIFVRNVGRPAIINLAHFFKNLVSQLKGVELKRRLVISGHPQLKRRPVPLPRGIAHGIVWVGNDRRVSFRKHFRKLPGLLYFFPGWLQITGSGFHLSIAFTT